MQIYGLLVLIVEVIGYIAIPVLIIWGVLSYWTGRGIWYKSLYFTTDEGDDFVVRRQGESWIGQFIDKGGYVEARSREIVEEGCKSEFGVSFPKYWKWWRIIGIVLISVIYLPIITIIAAIIALMVIV